MVFNTYIIPLSLSHFKSESASHWHISCNGAGKKNLNLNQLFFSQTVWKESYGTFSRINITVASDREPPSFLMSYSFQVIIGLSAQLDFDLHPHQFILIKSYRL